MDADTFASWGVDYLKLVCTDVPLFSSILEVSSSST